MIRFFYISLLIIGLAAPVLAQKAEEYLIYDAVIDNIFAGGDNADFEGLPKLLLILDETVKENRSFTKPELEERIRWAVSDVSDDALKDLSSKLDKSLKLTDVFSLKSNYRLISREQLNLFFKGSNGGGWKKFHETYPDSDGYAGFSRVGFNGKKDNAIVYFEYSCGGLCGSGYYLTLNKKKGHWEVSSRKMVWVS